jgi:phage tail protein X
MGIDMTDAIAVSKTDDMLDYIVWKHYRKQSGYVEAVLEASYRISSQPEKLPAGVAVSLPDVAIIDPPIKLWED